MIRFNSDYQEGAHPRILQKLLETNLVQTNGYGEDPFCDEARELIKKVCKAPNAYVQFLVGGTQANFTVLAAMLRPWQGVLAADTAHIATHETGSVEATGHKVLTLKNTLGKIGAAQVEEFCSLHFTDESHEHMVMPGAVYISYPTEFGTLYSRKELQDLRAVCDRYALKLFCDGARLGYGLASAESDIDIPFLAEVCDAFYIGGTKQGALFGEAVVILNDEVKKDFRYGIKQHGGMLAKGRLLGIQFTELFRDDLYMELSRHAARLAERMREGLRAMGVKFLMESPTNQQFPILPDSVLEELKKKYAYASFGRVDETHSAARFCTSWATEEANVDALLADIRALLEK